MSRSGKKVSTFDIERQKIVDCCKQTFHFQLNIKLIQSKTWFFQFSQWPCWMAPKVQISLYYRILTPIPPSFIKSLELYTNVRFCRWLLAFLLVQMETYLLKEARSKPRTYYPLIFKVKVFLKRPQILIFKICLNVVSKPIMWSLIHKNSNHT